MPSALRATAAVLIVSAGCSSPEARERDATSDARRDASVEAASSIDALPDVTDAAIDTARAACTEDDFEPVPTAVALGRRDVPARGGSSTLDIPAGLAFVRVTLDDPQAAVQVDQAVLADGTAVIAPADPGAFCRRCTQRESVVVGSGFFAWPSDDTASAPAARFAFGLRDTQTLGSVLGTPPAVGASISLLPLRDHADGTRAELRIDVAGTAGTFLATLDDEYTRARLAAAIAGQFPTAGITLALGPPCVVPSPDGTLVVRTDDTRSLAGFLATARATCPWLVHPDADPHVVVAQVDCLSQTDPTDGTTRVIYGATTHVPSGGGTAAVPDAIVLGESCGLTYAVQDGLPVTLPRVLAHEIGHYLGLYHSVESDGTTDLLADTTADNLMNAFPTQAGATGLAPSQVRIVRRHPTLRWPRAGREACVGE